MSWGGQKYTLCTFRQLLYRWLTLSKHHSCETVYFRALLIPCQSNTIKISCFLPSLSQDNFWSTFKKAGTDFQLILSDSRFSPLFKNHLREEAKEEFRVFFGNLLICVSYHRKHRRERHLNIVTYQPSGMVSTVIDSIVAREVKVSL